MDLMSTSQGLEISGPQITSPSDAPGVNGDGGDGETGKADPTEFDSLSILRDETSRSVGSWRRSRRKLALVVRASLAALAVLLAFCGVQLMRGRGVVGRRLANDNETSAAYSLLMLCEYPNVGEEATAAASSSGVAPQRRGRKRSRVSNEAEGNSQGEAGPSFAADSPAQGQESLVRSPDGTSSSSSAQDGTSSSSSSTQDRGTAQGSSPSSRQPKKAFMVRWTQQKIEQQHQPAVRQQGGPAEPPELAHLQSPSSVSSVAFVLQGMSSHSALSGGHAAMVGGPSDAGDPLGDLEGPSTSAHARAQLQQQQLQRQRLQLQGQLQQQQQSAERLGHSGQQQGGQQQQPPGSSSLLPGLSSARRWHQTRQSHESGRSEAEQRRGHDRLEELLNKHSALKLYVRPLQYWQRRDYRLLLRKQLRQRVSLCERIAQDMARHRLSGLSSGELMILQQRYEEEVKSQAKQHNADKLRKKKELEKEMLNLAMQLYFRQKLASLNNESSERVRALLRGEVSTMAHGQSPGGQQQQQQAQEGGPSQSGTWAAGRHGNPGMEQQQQQQHLRQLQQQLQQQERQTQRFELQHRVLDHQRRQQRDRRIRQLELLRKYVEHKRIQHESEPQQPRPLQPLLQRQQQHFQRQRPPLQQQQQLQQLQQQQPLLQQQQQLQRFPLLIPLLQRPPRPQPVPPKQLGPQQLPPEQLGPQPVPPEQLGPQPVPPEQLGPQPVPPEQLGPQPVLQQSRLHHHPPHLPQPQSLYNPLKQRTMGAQEMDPNVQVKKSPCKRTKFPGRPRKSATHMLRHKAFWARQGIEMSQRVHKQVRLQSEEAGLQPQQMLFDAEGVAQAPGMSLESGRLNAGPSKMGYLHAVSSAEFGWSGTESQHPLGMGLHQEESGQQQQSVLQASAAPPESRGVDGSHQEEEAANDPAPRADSH